MPCIVIQIYYLYSFNNLRNLLHYLKRSTIELFICNNSVIIGLCLRVRAHTSPDEKQELQWMKLTWKRPKYHASR